MYRAAAPKGSQSSEKARADLFDDLWHHYSARRANKNLSEFDRPQKSKEELNKEIQSAWKGYQKKKGLDMGLYNRRRQEEGKPVQKSINIDTFM
jgi:hypothetical protein